MKKLLQIFVNTLEPAETYTHTHTHTHTDKPCQIKKQIGTICLMLISFFIFPTFATEITDPATCDSGTLSTDTGPTNLRANYESNQLNLKWYDDNGNQLNVQNESNSCTYGGSITMPDPPTKRGYTFKGWKVSFDLNVLASSINVNGTMSGYRSNDGNNNSNSKVFGLDHTGMFGVLFNNGKVVGEAFCSDQGAGLNVGNTGTITVANDGPYCWCRVTNFVSGDNDTSTVTGNVLPVLVSQYVFSYDYRNLTNCQRYCAANRCAYMVMTDSDFRRAVFGITQQ